MTPFHAFSKVEEPSVIDTLLKSKDVQPLPSSQLPVFQKTQSISESSTDLKELPALKTADDKAEIKQTIAPITDQKRVQGLYVTINATVKPNKSYEVTIEPASKEPLFILPLKKESFERQKTIVEEVDGVKKIMVVPTLLDRFFTINKRRFIFNSESIQKPEVLQAKTIPQKDEKKRPVETYIPSYMDTINTIDLAQAQTMLAQQGVATRSRNYFLEKLLKVDPVVRAKTLAKEALAKFNTSMRDILANDDYAIKGINLLDPEQIARNPKARMIYNAIREFGQVIGFEMPSIEKPWYVRHKGKIALTAGTVALLTYMHYSNALGTRTPVAQQNVQTVQPASVVEPSFMQKAQGRIGTYLTNVAAKAGIEKAAAAQGEIVPPTSTWRQSFERWLGGTLHRAAIKHQAQVEGLIPKSENQSWFGQKVEDIKAAGIKKIFPGWRDYQPTLVK